MKITPRVKNGSVPARQLCLPAGQLCLPARQLGWVLHGLLLLTLIVSCNVSAQEPTRIMFLGDSITAGYTDNPVWDVPFEFGYRSGLYTRLSDAGYSFQFVGSSAEPFNNRFGDPTRGGTVSPTLDLRTLGAGRGTLGAGRGTLGQDEVRSVRMGIMGTAASTSAASIAMSRVGSLPTIQM